MKESKFNLFYDLNFDKNKVLAYNSRSNALALIERKEYEKFKKCSLTRKYNLDQEFINQLKEGYFLIEDYVNELEILRYEQQSARYNSTYLGLTIAPTLGCNFNCIYCYEDDHKNYKNMDNKTQENLLNFISNQCKTINSLSITWYGGEPLLAFDVIKTLSGKIISICNENKISYSANIVTNGYLLTTDLVKDLRNIGINNMQITLDGPEDIHDKRRVLQGGQGTFRRIVDNIKSVVEYFPDISLRINVDKENHDRINEVLELLIENNLQGKVHPYLGYVEPTNEIYNEDNCLTVDKFSDIDVEFTDNLIGESSSIKYPKLVSNNCCSDNNNAFVVDPKGNLYKCWSDIGIEEYCIGNLSEGINNKLRIIEYTLYDSTNDEECKECKILPICMGGCPRRRIDDLVDRCSPYKYNLEAWLQKIAKSKSS